MSLQWKLITSSHIHIFRRFENETKINPLQNSNPANQLREEKWVSYFLERLLESLKFWFFWSCTLHTYKYKKNFECKVILFVSVCRYFGYFFQKVNHYLLGSLLSKNGFTHYPRVFIGQGIILFCGLFWIIGHFDM